MTDCLAAVLQSQFTARRTLLALLAVIVFSEPATGQNEGSSTNRQPAASLVTGADLENTPISERKVSISAEQKPLKDVLAEICRQANVELELDVDGLKLSGVSVDTPVTLKCQDKSLGTAFVKIIEFLKNRGAIAYDVFFETRNGKFYVTSLRGRTARENQVLPDWLKSMNNIGLVLKLDEQNNVVSISVGAKADDEFLAKLKTLPKLHELDIEATKIITPQGLEHLAELPALEKLSLYEVNTGNDGLGNAALKAVSKIRTLRDLSVAECGVTDAGMTVLKGMTQLTSLSLAGNSVTDAGVKYLAGLTNLQQLDLSQTAWIHSGMGISDEGLKYLSNLTALRGLSVGGLAFITDAGLKHLSKLTELRDFSFAGSAVTTKNLPFSHLQSLEFSGDQVTDATLDNIGQYHDLQNLTLRYTSVTDVGMKRIAGLKELRRLTLDSYEITDAGIDQLRTLPKLEYLWLRADSVSDASLASLAEIKSLTRLDLFGNGRPGVSSGQVFTMDGLLQLKKLPNLRELWINNLVLSEGFLGLRELKQLRALTLSFCQVKDAEQELLQAAMLDASVSAVSGSMMLNQAQPVTLPEVSVRITGLAVDAGSGQPVQNCTLEFGADNPDKPGEIIWGEALPGGRMEVAGIDPQDKSHFWGESFRPGKVWTRLLASGYQPALLTPNPVTAPLQLTNQIVRLKRSSDFHGSVLDYQRNPVPGIRVYLADKPNFYLRDGVENSAGKTGYSVTDANGRFTLSGGNGTPQRLVAASADGQLFQVEPQAKLNQDIQITLPQPAALILHYDIPDDFPVAECFLNFRSQNLDQAMWSDTSFGLSPVITNRSEIILTNLTPGNYELGRRKMLHVGKGRRFQFLDDTNLVLKAGETQRVDIVRPVGQTVSGQVTGIEAAGALGAYLYACIGEITNSPISSWNPGPLIDLGTCGKDGAFQMARFPPGKYSIVAMAYKEPDVYSHSLDADFIGVAKVTVGADVPPQSVKIELHPRKAK